MELRTTTCCGLREFSGLQKDPVDTLMYIASQIVSGGASCAFILFTDPVTNGNGTALRDLIQKNGLGTVTETPSKINPNSRRELQAFIYAQDKDALTKWYTKKKDKYLEDAGGGFKLNDEVTYNPDSSIPKTTYHISWASFDNLYVCVSRERVARAQNTNNYIPIRDFTRVEKK